MLKLLAFCPFQVNYVVYKLKLRLKGAFSVVAALQLALSHGLLLVLLLHS